MSLLRGVRRQAQPVECVTNSGKDNKHNSVTLAFETECVARLTQDAQSQRYPVKSHSRALTPNLHTPHRRCSIEDVEQALTLGLLRVGVQLGGFKKKPVRKGYITCQDMLEVLPYDEHADHSDHHIDVRN